MKAKKNYSFSSNRDEDVIPEEELKGDPFLAVSPIAEVDEEDVDDDDGIADGLLTEDAEDEESEEALGAHGFTVVTGEKDDEM